MATSTPPSPITGRPTGLFAFTVVWLGQMVSVLATNMTGFALTIWVYEKTSSATALGLMQVCFITPFLLISPFAGVMVDRHNRKLMMMMSDLGAGVGTIAILVLQSAGVLEIWHLYVSAIIMGTFNAFQWPAYSAAISLMVPKQQYTRVNGMMSLIEAGPGVFSPLLAGALLPLIGFTGILLFVVATFLLAILALTVVFIPQPPRTEDGVRASGGILKEAVYGFRYIFERPSLLGLQLVFLTGNLMAGIGMTVMAPMILARTSNNEQIFGLVQSVGAIGGVIGGLAISAWGGPKRRVHGVLIGWFMGGLLGQFLMGIGNSLPIWLVAAFANHLVVPLVNSSNQAIWQAKVAPDLQGRVFSARRLIAWVTQPIAPMIAGPLADFVLEPAMQQGGWLSTSLSPITGSGSGAGMALILIVTGLLAALVGLGAYAFPVVRDAEDLLPDHTA